MANHHYPNHHTLGLPAQSPPRRSGSTSSPGHNSQLSSPSPPTTPTVATTSSNHSTPFTILNAAHYKLLVNGTDSNALQDEFDYNFIRFKSKSNGNSPLHIASIIGQDHLIFPILTSSSDLLLRPNSLGDLPIHLAVRSGHMSTVYELVQFADESNDQNLVCQMLKATNAEENTALHIALENQQLCLANYLFDKCKHTFYLKNARDISPLYLAIKANFVELVRKMLLVEDVAVKGAAERSLRQGKSIVHALIMANNTETLEIMLNNWKEVIKDSVDERKRRPLSYAAQIGFLKGVNSILNTLSNLAFKPDDDGNFPIHSACIGGNLEIVKRIISLSTNMLWLVNEEGQNILHVAACSGKEEVVKYILGQRGIENLINMRDYSGRSPLHLGVMGKHPKVVYALTWDDRVNLCLQDNNGCTALDLAELYDDVPSFKQRLTWQALKYVGVPKSPINNTEIHLQEINPLNMSNATDDEVTDIETINFPKLIALIANTLNLRNNQRHQLLKRKNKYKDRVGTLLMVSTLVATVTFAAGFAVPGGYNQDKPDKGMATLANKHAFQVFVIADTIAMYSAILAVVTLIWAYLDDHGLVLLSLQFALPLLGTALATMSVAFMCGLYVVLHNQSWLGVVVLVMGGIFLCALMVFFIPLFPPTPRIKCKVFRNVIHLPFKLMLLACDLM